MFHSLTDIIGLPWILLNTIVLLIVYFAVFRNWNHFSKRGLKFIRGWPILGTQYKMFIGSESVCDSFVSIYKKFPNEPLVGVYGLLGDATYFIRDIEMIKRLTTTDFDSFTNHRFHIKRESDALFARTLLVTRDQQWKDARGSVSPAFTGSKMRLMFSLITQCSDDFCGYLKNEIRAEGIVYDFKDLMQRYVANTIGSCAFGLDINALRSRDLEFLTRSLEVADFDGLKGFKFFGYQAAPTLMNFFKVKIMSEENQNYFRDMIRTNIEYREANGIHRPDMINLMMEAKKGLLNHSDVNTDRIDNIGFATVHETNTGKSTPKLEKWEHDDIVAQCLIFIFGGFNAIPSSQCFMAHELALNQDIQQKLYAEVKAVHEKLGDSPITYEVLQSMNYMDQVVSETLRRWPVAAAMERCIDKPYVLEDGSRNRIPLQAGNGIWVPIIAIHLDEKYYPNPYTFDPERFSDENRGNIKTGTFIPFGLGNRNCIGSRFALMKMKSVFYHLLLHFCIERCEKTQHPLKLKKNTFSMDAENGFWVRLRPRN